MNYVLIIYSTAKWGWDPATTTTTAAAKAAAAEATAAAKA